MKSWSRSSREGCLNENTWHPCGLTRHHVLNGAVLARRIHRLKHKQQGPAVLRVEHVLLFREPLGAASEKFGRLALAQLQAAGVFRIDAVQAKALALGDAEGINVFLDAVQDLSSRHGVATSHHGAAHCPGRLFKAIAPCLICDGLSE